MPRLVFSQPLATYSESKLYTEILLSYFTIEKKLFRKQPRTHAPRWAPLWTNVGEAKGGPDQEIPRLLWGLSATKILTSSNSFLAQNVSHWQDQQRLFNQGLGQQSPEEFKYKKLGH